jgi:hypothetical protein
MATSSKLLSISKKLNKINKVDGVPNVHRTKTAEKLGIRVRKVTDKMLGSS